jgi:hypothetical protein
VLSQLWRARYLGEFFSVAFIEITKPMKIHSCVVSFVTTGLCMFSPFSLAHGISGGQSHEHYGYSGPYWGPTYSSYAGTYDSDYSYTPTPEQQATAKQQIKNYLAAVKKGKRHVATHRYISVETLKPTKKQLEEYTKNQRPERRAEPAQLRCLMVFDSQFGQFVGSGCYVLSSEPTVGQVTKFETVSAEFVGPGTP